MFKTTTNGRLPTRGSKLSACVDLYASEYITIKAGEIAIVPLGVTLDKEMILEKLMVEAPFDSEHYINEYIDSLAKTSYFQLTPRSSLALKTGLVITNGVGIIDIDYEGVIGIILLNTKKEDVTVKIGDRIAQIAMLYHDTDWLDIDTEDERTGGYGSTEEKKKLS